MWNDGRVSFCEIRAKCGVAFERFYIVFYRDKWMSNSGVWLRMILVDLIFICRCNFWCFVLVGIPFDFEGRRYCKFRRIDFFTYFGLDSREECGGKKFQTACRIKNKDADDVLLLLPWDSRMHLQNFKLLLSRARGFNRTATFSICHINCPPTTFSDCFFVCLFTFLFCPCRCERIEGVSLEKHMNKNMYIFFVFKLLKKPCFNLENKWSFCLQKVFNSRLSILPARSIAIEHPVTNETSVPYWKFCQ